MDFDAINVTVDDTGLATLTGLNYRDLNSLFTGATLHFDETKSDSNPMTGDAMRDEAIHENNMESAHWYLLMRTLLSVIHTKMDHAIRPMFATGDISSIRALHKWKVERLEEDVREAEKQAIAKQAEDAQTPPDPLIAISQKMAAALRMADSALAELDHVRRK
jgi:hypothetical protein